jgi:hypothetical protein
LKIEGTKRDGTAAGAFINISANRPHFSSGLRTYDINCNFQPTPKDMIEDKFTGFTIQLKGDYGYMIGLNSLTLTIAHKYKEGEVKEYIDVWERKYLPSTFSKGNDDFNLDGPGDHMSYNLDGNLSGVYFPFANVTDEVAAQDKMRSAYSNGRKQEDEELSISMGNLHDVENEKQKELYEEAYDLDPDDDTLIFSSVIPPVLSEQ